MNAGGGLYVLELVLLRKVAVKIGRLGRCEFPAGAFWYVGSARRGLAARIARHTRRSKKLHWHIDYLLARARLVRVWVWPETTLSECELTERLGGERAVPRFGASDCRCPGHLLCARGRALPESLGGVGWALTSPSGRGRAQRG